MGSALTGHGSADQADPFGWYQTATRSPQRLVLADSGDERAVQAATNLNERGLAQAEVVNPDWVDDDMREFASGLRKPVDLDDPLNVAMVAVALGRFDACVAGASRSTADVLRSAIRVLGVAPGHDAVSSSFFFVLPDGRPIAYGDCGVIPDPDANQLASIAVATAETYSELAAQHTDAEPRVAMLSFSTKGSAEHDNVTKVRNATELVRRNAPELAVDGELQFDAAWLPEVAESKAPGSPVAGRANVFIFPDLDAGNIAYKITERLGGADAYGPLLQGINGVVHDLSRGCSVDDIVAVSVIAAVQASARR